MERKPMIIAIIIALIVLVAAIPIGIVLTNNNSDGGHEVVNDLMKVKGIEKDGTVTFKDIPYAEAPVGELRFKPPVFKEANWTEVRDCTKFGNISIQGLCYYSDTDDTPTAKVTHKENESEDCLNLNIWAPADAKKGDKLPVYFWIHGGACIIGNGQGEDYDGTAFNRDDIIVVTINYRLGTLGFLGLDAFKNDNDIGTTGNWGTLDQICALKWVNKYIENFGGDPNNVTIGGESAGSFSVMNMVLSERAEGLFQKAIMESGSLMHLLEATWSYEDAVQVSRNVASRVGVTTDDATAIQKLREMDEFELADACNYNGFLYMGHSYSLWPVADGIVLPTNFLKAIQDGKYNNVKMIIGYNFNEGYLFTSPNVTEEQLNKYIDKVFPKTVEEESTYTAEKIKEYYETQKMKNPYDKMLELISMTMFKVGAIKVLEQFTLHGSTVYGYEFVHSTNGEKPATHGMEIAYAFGQDHSGDVVFDESDLFIMNNMHGYWVNFIKTGNPNGYGLDIWMAYDPAAGTAMHFGQTTVSTEHWMDTSTTKILMESYFEWKRTKP